MSDEAVRLVAESMEPKPFGLADTWPARAARGIYNAFMLPGDVYQGNVSITGEDGRTNPEAIARSADLAGLMMGGSLGAIPEGAVGSGFARMRVNPLEQADLGRELAVLRRNQGFATGKSAVGHEFKRPDADKGSFARAVQEVTAAWRGDRDRALAGFNDVVPKPNPYMTPADWQFIASGGFR
jgi:hypothetical protein